MKRSGIYFATPTGSPYPLNPILKTFMDQKRRRKILRQGPSKQAYNIMIDRFCRAWKEQMVQAECPYNYIKEYLPVWLKTLSDRYLDILSVGADGYYRLHDFDPFIREEVERRLEAKLLSNSD